MSDENRTEASDETVWLSDQPETRREVGRALSDIFVLLQYLGEAPDARLLTYFDDGQKSLSNPGTRRAGPPCQTYSEFLNQLLTINEAFQTGRSDSRPNGSPASAPEMEGLSPVAFVFWSRDFLSAVAAPATADSIRLTHEYVVYRARARWIGSIRWFRRREPTRPTAVPSRLRDLEERTRQKLARKIGSKLVRRVRVLEYCTLAGLFVTACVSVYALSGRLILANEQEMEEAWSKIDTQVEAQEGMIFKAAAFPLSENDPTSVGTLCSMRSLAQPHEAKYQVADATPLGSTSDASRPPSDPRGDLRYVSAPQAHLCANRGKVLHDLFVVTVHLQSWNSVVTDSPRPLGISPALLFGVMPSTIERFAQDERDSGCFQIMPSLPKNIASDACKNIMMDQLDRSHNVARAILGSITLYVLPVLYGFLGAMASTLRTLRRKVDASLLSATDFGGILQGAILGILCGGVIGLFATYIGKADAVGGLGISALALLAGYNVGGVFRFLDELSDRLFRPNPPPASGHAA